MTKDSVDFSMIHQALQHSYQQLTMSADDISSSTLTELHQAQEDLKSAMALATNVDKRYWSYKER
jgi:hypothetical protein